MGARNLRGLGAAPGQTEAGGADVPHISGGIDADERAAFAAKENEYNLRIITFDKSGNYLSTVRLVIESASNERVLDTTMAGPILLAKLAPGDVHGQGHL